MGIIRIVKIGINGEGIGFEGSTPILLYGAVPGDLVEYSVETREKGMVRGKVRRILEGSPSRKENPCPRKSCEGCPLIMTEYKAQLEWKRRELADDLRKRAGVPEEKIEPVLENPFPLGYRNLVKLPLMEYHGRLETGMYRRNSNRLSPVYGCRIHEEGLERVRGEVMRTLNAFHVPLYDRKTRKGMRYLYLRGMQGKYQLALAGGRDPYPSELADALMGIEGMNSIYQNVQTVHEPHEALGRQMIHLAGTKALSFTVDRTHLVLSLASFYQMNTVQAQRMYRLVVGMLPEHVSHLVEAYCGIGAMSLLARDRADRIEGIEYAESSVRDAGEALKRNDAGNVRFIRGDAAQELAKIAKKDPVDALIADPPRTGLEEAMAAVIERARIPLLIYVSCNPYTLARDIARLSRYEAERVVPVDMLSQTPHVESVCLLKRKK